VWPVSTGRRGYTTPTGSFRPYSLRRHHRSRKYYNSPMPYSIFYRGGYAIHGTNAVSRLGRTASHGCIRLHKRNARELFDMVKYYGKRSTRIIVHR
nr:L,D-transpeptidase [Hyphomicrobiales bacterium]